MHWYLFLSLLFAPLSAYSEQSIKALIACDTLSELKFSTRRDFIHVRSILREVSVQTGLRLNINSLLGPSLSSENVQSWVQSVEREAPDVVFFYYSGHGSRSESATIPWPCLFFPQAFERFRSADLCARLRTLRSRLVIVILDCCNTPTTSLPPTLPDLIPKGIQRKIPLPGLTSLFLDTQGIIIAAGATPGEDSFALENGGLFTNSLIQAIHVESSATNVSWDSIFNLTSLLCSPTQRPFSSLQISPVRHGPKKKKLHRVKARESHAGRVNRHKMEVARIMRIAS
jgi:hypothetical protein